MDHVVVMHTLTYTESPEKEAHIDNMSDRGRSRAEHRRTPPTVPRGTEY